MERIRSRTAHALGGGWRFSGGGLLAAVCAALLLVGVGCTGPRAVRMKDFLPVGWVPSQPAVQIVPAFTPQIQHLPNPAQEGVLQPGIVGQMFILAADGSYTNANGDLYVMAEDITARAPGEPQQVMEVWHFDPIALRKMRTSDERFGECYALFLPYPANWKDVTQARISTRFEPKGDRTKEPVLNGPPQTLLLDFTPPGSQPAVWLDKSGSKPTAPVEMRSMPNVARDIARGGLKAPLTGPQLNNATVPAGGVPPAATNPLTPTGGVPGTTGPLMPSGGASGPLPPAGMPLLAPPPGATASPLSNIPLPPPVNFTPDRPQTSMRGPNGETLNVTAMALPPGQSVPNGWQKQNDGSIQPAGVITQPTQGLAQQQQQWQQPTQQGGYTQPSNYVPASQKYQSASERWPASSGRIQHGAFNQPQQPQTGLSGSLPPLPATAVQGQHQVPPVQNVPGGNTPMLPTTPGGVSGSSTPLQIPPAPAQGFDPNSPVGAWANQPPPAPPVPPPNWGGTPSVPMVPPPPSNPDGPLMPIIR